MSLPDEPLVAPIARPAATDATASATDFHGFPTNPTGPAGEFHLRPHLFASVVHADGLPVLTGTRVTSDIYTFAPGLLADLGEHWTFDYTATVHNYSAKELRDSVDHEVRLVGADKSPDWNFQLTESYSITNSILVETAAQTKQKTWVNALSAEHNFGNLLRYQGTAGMTKTTTEALSDTNDWTTEQWLRAAVSPKVVAGLGFGLGYSDIIARPNTHYEKYLGEFKWRPTDKVNLLVQGGWEDWHSLSAAVGDQRNPILQATLEWLPFDQTRFSLTDGRHVSNALFGNSAIESNTWGASLNQRLFGVLFLNLTYNHDSSNYRSGPGSLLTDRSDDTNTFYSSLSVVLFKHWNLGVTYQTSKNDSNQALFKYDSKQYGLELRAKF